MTICIGRPIIGILAKHGAWESGTGESVVAASDLFGSDPYDEIERLRDALDQIAEKPYRAEEILAALKEQT